jgi:hypothetical protein
MSKVILCDSCLKAYEPEEIDGVRRLKEFEGYTIDLRLQQFRKVPLDDLPEFIEFDSKEGIALLKRMHLALLN